MWLRGEDGAGHKQKLQKFPSSHLDLPLFSVMGPLKNSAPSDDATCAELIF